MPDFDKLARELLAGILRAAPHREAMSDMIRAALIAVCNEALEDAAAVADRAAEYDSENAEFDGGYNIAGENIGKELRAKKVAPLSAPPAISVDRGS